MRARVGDRLIPDGDRCRIGLVTGLRSEDGSPPYAVKWVSCGHVALVFPGPYARILTRGPSRQRDRVSGNTEMSTPPARCCRSTARLSRRPGTASAR